MKKFKAGDNVIFTDCKTSRHGVGFRWARESCIKDGIYTITEVDPHDIKVLGNDLWLNSSQFTLQQEEKFVLPTKWCIKDCGEVANYAAARFGCSNLVGDRYLCVNEELNRYTFEDAEFIKIEGCKKITKAQFRKYVLKESVTEEVKEVLPEKWCVKRNEDNYIVLNSWANSQQDVVGTSSRSGWMHSINYGDTGWDGYGYFYANHKAGAKHPDHTEITFDQFQRLVLKQQPEVKRINEPIKKSVMKETAKTFKITSKSKALLEAMWKELVAIGYDGQSCQDEFTTITHNYRGTSALESKEKFRNLWDDINIGNDSPVDVIFRLPEQYNEAIEFAKEQLLDKYWIDETKFKEGDMVVVETWYYSSDIKLPQTAKITDINTDRGNTEPYKIDVSYGTISGWWFRKGEFRLATPEEIKVYKNNLLLEEANKRFPKDTRVLCNLGNFSDHTFTRKEELKVYESGNIAAAGEPWVYFEGEWAEVIPENIEIKGYSCEFDGDTVGFGCQTFNKQTALDLVRLLDLGVITSEYDVQLREVAEHFND